MKLAGKIIAIAALAAAGVTVAAADEFDKPLKVRKGLMQLYAYNLGTLGGMAKGAIEYDAEKAQTAANNLLALSKMSDGGMWPQGSDSTALGEDRTHAKVEMWTTFPAVLEKSKALTEASAKMAEVAGNGVEAVQGQMKAVGDSCGGCHKEYRVEKK